MRYSRGTLVRWTILALLAFLTVTPGGRGEPDNGAAAAAVLESRCVACHHTGKARGGLDLTTRDAALRGGEHGPALVPGNARASLLYKLATHAAEPHMPLKQSKLPDAEVTGLAAWIDGGARYPRRLAPPAAALASELWSLRPLRPVAPPALTDAWCRTPVDRFVLAPLLAKGLRPSPAADKRTLIRRATFDLTGLPPTPEEVDAFLNDQSSDAWPRVVDRLLASPAYGERWGRHWLDVARYADSDGYELDSDRPTAYHYRDFVIRAFNDDLPFDTFVRWNLAGDEFRPGDPTARVATGFCTAGPQVVLIPEIGIGTPAEREHNRYDELDNVVSTVGEAFLGLTVGCARCHDHKFDPITSRDYYRLVADFASSKRVDEYLDPAAARAYERRVAEIKQARATAKSDFDTFVEARTAAIRAARVAELPISDAEKALLTKGNADDPARKQLVARFAEVLLVNGDQLRKTLSAEEVNRMDALEAAVKAATLLPDPGPPPKALSLSDIGREPVPAFLLAAGDSARKTERISAGALTALSAVPFDRWLKERPKEATTTYQRAALANWMTDCEAGAGRLLARVFVNRVWQHHFGEGLVRTPNDFGTQGLPPTHPELLDWLANDFIAGGWKVKRLHRLLLSSAAYLQSSSATPDRRSGDPDGLLLSYRRPERLDAIVLRDTVLAVSGKLDRTMFGPAIKPALPIELHESGPGAVVPRSIFVSPTEWRRGIYLFAKRSRPIPILNLFDEPAGTDSCGRRFHSTVAAQALHLLNSEFVRHQSRFFAERVATDVGAGPEDRVRHAYALALGRPPDDRELRDAVHFLRGGDPQRMLADFCQVLLTLNEFAYVD